MCAHVEGPNSRKFRLRWALSLWMRAWLTPLETCSSHTPNLVAPVNYIGVRMGHKNFGERWGPGDVADPLERRPSPRVTIPYCHSRSNCICVSMGSVPKLGDTGPGPVPVIEVVAVPLETPSNTPPPHVSANFGRSRVERYERNYGDPPGTMDPGLAFHLSRSLKVTGSVLPVSDHHEPILYRFHGRRKEVWDGGKTTAGLWDGSPPAESRSGARVL